MGFWGEVGGLVLPGECAGCGVGRGVLCAGCGEGLSGVGAGVVRPRPGPPGLPVVHAAAGYAEGVRAVLLAHKERGALPLARALGGALAAAVLAGGDEGDRGGLVLVPVPSARRQVRARGHDPARRIALAASARLRRAGIPARVAPVLRQRRYVADQAGLGARQRRENLAGALEVRPGGVRLLGAGRTVLVDDLITTGATLAEAARALAAADGCPAGLRAAVVAAPVDSFERGSATRTEQKSRE
ncbi:ComF family protein [Streptomyces sp. NBC_00536]|uniref:ComF family protein n=1 Tax=Streptomyces sp. NBC_00536 TaxID=2975769 RepID=UPI002E80AD56|nr:ComF family protein [Streptomyces sp. NBC_00536]WUC79356.1 ComF family protein [Streptomyces sp. NBC_00536]